jgi:RNA polymerase sigma-70 factor (ECF subfamily)
VPDIAWEKACLERIRRGDLAAFGELYRRFAPQVFERVLLPMLGERAAAEDALAETFRSALQNIGRFEAREAGLGGWLAAIARNKAHDVFRARQRAGRAMQGFEALLAPVLGTEPSADEALSIEERRARLRAAVERVLSRINPRYRKAIELRFFAERSREECAAALDVSVATLDVVMLRALRAFRAAWEEMGEEEP